MKLVIYLTRWIRSSTGIISSNIIGELPMEYDNPSEEVRKKSGDLDDTKKALVTTTDTVSKEDNTVMVDKKGKQNLMC